MISEELSALVKRLLKKEDIQSIAIEMNMSYGYIKDIVYGIRYNAEVEQKLKDKCKEVAKDNMEQINSL